MKALSGRSVGPILYLAAFWHHAVMTARLLYGRRSKALGISSMIIQIMIPQASTLAGVIISFRMYCCILPTNCTVIINVVYKDVCKFFCAS